jgi:AcrR family transcriptional regulator
MTEANQKRQDILDAAAQLFARSGYDGATIRDIARAAHVSTGTIHAQFKNKDQLLDAAVAERLGLVVREIREATSGLSSSDGLAACLRTLFMRLSQDALLARLLTFEAGLSTRLADRHTTQLALQIEAIGRFHLEDAASVLKIKDRQAAATIIRSSLSGWLLAEQRGAKQASAEQTADALVLLLLGAPADR